jgi:hypothetical protein
VRVESLPILSKLIILINNKIKVEFAIQALFIINPARELYLATLIGILLLILGICRLHKRIYQEIIIQLKIELAWTACPMPS